MTTRQRLTAVLAALALLLGVGAFSTAVQADTYATDSGATTTHAAGIVRLGPDYTLHNTSGHAALGITNVYVSSGNLVVIRTVQPGEQILGCYAVPDESLAALGITPGCSGGGATSVIQFWDRDGNKVHAMSSVFGSTANVWLRFDGLIPPPAS